MLEGGTGLNLTWEVRDGIANHTKSGRPATLEGQIVNLSDRIAYINHDIDDALRARIIAKSDLPAACIQRLGEGQSARINAMIRDVIASSQDLTSIRHERDDRRSHRGRSGISCLPGSMWTARPRARKKRPCMCCRSFFRISWRIPGSCPRRTGRISVNTGEEQVVCDYIAGMTDRYAMKAYERLFIPSAWQL